MKVDPNKNDADKANEGSVMTMMMGRRPGSVVGEGNEDMVDEGCVVESRDGRATDVKRPDRVRG